MPTERIMSGDQYHVLTRTILESKRTAAEKVVLIALADYADNSTQTAWPGITGLAKRVGMFRGSVSRILKKLHSDGILSDEGLSDKDTVNRQIHHEMLRHEAQPRSAASRATLRNRARSATKVAAPRGPTVLITDLTTDLERREPRKKTATTKKAAPFTPPTVADVVAYNATLDEPIDDDECRRFVEWFEAREWHDSKNRKVRFWKSNFATWRSNHKPTKRSNGLPYENVVPMVDPGQEYVDAMFAEFRAKGIKY